MQNWLKISHYKHTAKLRPHEYTSYVPLALLLVATGLILLGCTFVSAATLGPDAGSVALNGVMPEPPPTVGATIDSPTGQQHFNTTPVTVSGSCPANTLVEIYKNDIFAGSTACSSNGRYEINVDLLTGQDALVAKVFDVLNQQGPDSKTVTVFYDALPPQAGALASLNFGGSPLLLNTDAVFRGVFPNQSMSIPVTILGGTPPYALNIQWGDTKNTVVSRSDNLTFNVQHTYTRAGTNQISMQATDAQGRVAFLTVAAIVNGQPAVAPTASTTKVAMNKFLVLWPLYTSAVGIAISFWLGERREKHILATAGPVYHPAH